jgi:predicted nucleic acid-binding protein
MGRYRLYLDASVWIDLAADLNEPGSRRTATRRFLNRAARDHRLLVSATVIHEVLNRPSSPAGNLLHELRQSRRAEFRPPHQRVERVAEQLRTEGELTGARLADLTHLGWLYWVRRMR